MGRYILTDIEFLNRRMTLGTVYGPSSGDQPEFFEEVFNKITSFDSELIVVGGDWNAALNHTLDTNHPSNIYRNRSRVKIQEFIEQCDVVDIFEVCTCILMLESTHGKGLMLLREADWIILLFLNSLVVLLKVSVLLQVTVQTTRSCA